MKITEVVVTVEFREEDKTSIRRSCLIDTSESKKILQSVLTDACQRAVAHCVDELEEYL